MARALLRLDHRAHARRRSSGSAACSASSIICGTTTPSAKRCARPDLKVRCPPMTVGHVCAESTGREFFTYQLRNARTIGSIDPLGHLGAVITHPVRARRCSRSCSAPASRPSRWPALRLTGRAALCGCVTRRFGVRTKLLAAAAARSRRFCGLRHELLRRHRHVARTTLPRAVRRHAAAGFALREIQRMRTLFMQAPSYDGFDGGAGARYQARREIKSYWYPTWLAQLAAMVPDSKLIDAAPHGIGPDEVGHRGDALRSRGAALLDAHLRLRHQDRRAAQIRQARHQGRPGRRQYRHRSARRAGKSGSRRFRHRQGLRLHHPRRRRRPRLESRSPA